MDFNEQLRYDCKLQKAIYNTTYKQIADAIGIKQSSFYNWLKGYYSLSERRLGQLYYYLDKIKKER